MRRLLYILLGFHLLFICNPITAQTAYYSQTRIVRGETSTTETSGGQYITFADNVVYESDRDGYQVNNSKLEFWKSENGIKFYKGRSYWGTGTIFAFNDDKSIMNVFSQDGTKYVYRKSVAPSGQKTCSLLKTERQVHSQGACETFIPQQIQSVPIYNTTTAITQSSSTSSRPREVHYKEKCFKCNGLGRVKVYFSVPTFGHDREVWCEECHSTHFASDGHTHVDCDICHGSGYIDRVTYK